MTPRRRTPPAAEVHAVYIAERGRAMSASSRRLRWRARRLPRHSTDPRVSARAKAIRDELRDRGEGHARVERANT